MNTAIAPTKPTSVRNIEIEGIVQPAILSYFASLNAADFHATASLFAANGEMHPPFEEAIIGPAAIAVYLRREARGMKLQPRQGRFLVLEDGTTQVEVTGKVQTSWFGVNVAWQFVLDTGGEILYVAIKLLASPQELLKLRR